MLRADMDALPIAENTGLDVCQQGLRDRRRRQPRARSAHMCGHDMHMTWLVGAATLLRRRAMPGGHIDGGFPARRIRPRRARR